MVPTLVRSPYDTAACHCLAVDPRRHRILTPVAPDAPLPSWPWLEFCRRVVGHDRLVVYWHMESRVFVLGVWVWAPWEASIPLIQELETFEGRPDSVWPDGLLMPDIMRSRLAPVVDERARLERKINDRLKAERYDREEDLRHRTEVSKFMKRCGLERGAQRLASGKDHFMGRATMARMGIGEDTIKGLMDLAKRS